MPKTLLLAAALFTFTVPATAETLITETEAALPAANGITMRGVTRGPSVKLINPSETKSPFALKVVFEAHGGAKVEPSSVKVVYLKSPAVDITDRVKPFITANGIDMGKAEVPPGQHAIRVDVKDSDGRTGSATLQLTVNK